MSKRWLSGSLIFAFGFGCASLVTIATARENMEAGGLEEGLGYVNTENEIRLVNTGKNIYVAMVTRRAGTESAEAPVEFAEGILSIPKFELDRLKVYRLVGIAELDRDFWRPCSMGDCSWTGPLPPPPPPIMPADLSAKFLTPE